MKNNNIASITDPWVISSTLHGFLAVAVLFMLFHSQRVKTSEVEIVVIESPKVAQTPIQITAPRVEPKQVPAHEVFGISPKAVTSEQGEAVKAGNTVAKAPDQEILKPGDADALPIPSEEYLVTNMPEIKSEVRIPYPPESKKKGIQGAVVMDLLIDDIGKVREVTVVEAPNQELSKAAMSAAKGFEFSPAHIQKKAVAVRIRYTYRFVLER